jgi:hypothetical protein
LAALIDTAKSSKRLRYLEVRGTLGCDIEIKEFEIDARVRGERRRRGDGCSDAITGSED